MPTVRRPSRTDAASFSLGSPLNGGRIVDAQLKVKAALNFEAKSSYSVKIFVDKAIREIAGSPPSLQTTGFEEKDSIDVTINVTNVNEAPAFVADTEDISITRYTSVSDVIGTVVATDPDVAGDNTDTNPRTDDADALAYSLSGDDAASFDIDSETGQLKTKTGVAFDRTTKSSYMVTVTASDGEFTASTSVVITVVVTPVCDRTEQVRDAIVAAVGVTDCADVTETHLAAITSLSLFSQSITALKAGDFDGLTALTTLSLNNNQISTLPAGVFDKLTALTTLYLYSNQISMLTAGVFGELTALTRLDLDNNQISTLTEEVFDGLTALTTLYLHENQISTLPAGVFEGLTALTTLYLNDNTVHPLPLTVSLKQVAEGEFKATAHTGAPFAMVLPVTVTNGSIDGTATTITIPIGNVESGSLTVTRTPGTTAAVTVNIGTLPGLPSNHQGYALSKSSDLPLTVISDPSNNAPTFTDGTETTREVAENTAAGENIGDPVAATDDDTTDTLTYRLNGTDADSFDIVSTSGQLQTKAALDYETDNSYSVTVSVSDGNGGTDSIAVTINVTNVNEAPTFPGTTDTRSVAENTEAATNIDTAVAATDPDVAGTNTDVNPDDATVDALTYTLGGTDAASFDIVSTSGQLQTKAALDYETDNSYSVTVTVSDGGTDTASVTVTINVTNVNEAPTFPATTATRSVAESTEAATNIGAAVAATDPDVAGTNTDVNPDDATVDALTYTPGGTDAASFDIVSTSGQLQTKAALDYETKSSYSVTVTVSDGGTDTASVTVTISVTDVDETQPTVSITVPSGVQNGAFDVTVVFSEAVTGFVQSELVVTGTSGSSITAWNPQTGGTDYEATITPTETGTAIFNVAANVAKDTADNQNTAATQKTVQVDMTSPTVSITVPSGVQNGAFDVTVVFSEAVTGFVQSELVVTGTSGASITAWNPQTGGTDYRATITPTSSGTAIFNVAANVAKDAADNQNTAATQQTVQVNLTRPTVIINVPSGVQNSAFDVTVVFSEAVTGFVQSELVVTGTSGSSITAWNPQTGGMDYKATITPTSSGTAIFNVAANVAVDNDSNQNTAAIQQTVAIDLTQVDPNVPTDGDADTRPDPIMVAMQNGVEKRDQTVTFATFPGTFQLVMDFDRPVTGFERSELAVHRLDTGVTVTGWRVSSDRTVYTATVQVSHTGGVTFTVPANAAQAVDDGQGNVETKLTVIVKGDPNQPNRAPVFSEGTRASRTVAENTPSSRSIGSPVTATDADGDTLTYLLSGTDASSFGIDVVTGQLQTQADLDYETKSSYTVTITVSDDISSTDALTDTITVTINVTDVDETVSNNAPAFASNRTTRSVAENTSANQNIGSPVSATDPNNDTLTYSLGGTDASSFAIVSTTGQLKTKAALDHETKDEYTVTVEASDNRGGTDTITVTINVTDVDEAPPNRPPAFAAESTTRSIAETTKQGVKIGEPVSATDPDGNTLTYSLEGTDAASFSIETSTGQLKTKAALDRDTKSQYSVIVKVSDGKGGTDTITVTINTLTPDRPEPLMYVKQNGVEKRDQTVTFATFPGTFQLVMLFDQPVTGF